MFKIVQEEDSVTELQFYDDGIYRVIHVHCSSSGLELYSIIRILLNTINKRIIQLYTFEKSNIAENRFFTNALFNAIIRISEDKLNVLCCLLEIGW